MRGGHHAPSAGSSVARVRNSRTALIAWRALARMNRAIFWGCRRAISSPIRPMVSSQTTRASWSEMLPIGARLSASPWSTWLCGGGRGVVVELWLSVVVGIEGFEQRSELGNLFAESWVTENFFQAAVHSSACSLRRRVPSRLPARPSPARRSRSIPLRRGPRGASLRRR